MCTSMDRRRLFNSGMAGFLIVQGGPGTLDREPEVAAAKDIPMAFQLVKSLSDGSVVLDARVPAPVPNLVTIGIATISSTTGRTTLRPRP